jgi:hypothetical protein
VDVEGRERMTLRTASPAVLAIAAIAIDLVIDAIPWWNGASHLSFAFFEDLPIHAKLSNAVALLVGPIVIAVGIVLLRRGRPSVASGVFIAAGSMLAAGVLSELLRTIEVRNWQMFALVGLQAVEAVLLFLAASRARREEPTAT